MRRLEGVSLGQDCDAVRLDLSASGTECISKRRARRSARPSSWVRRRAAAARQAAAMDNSGEPQRRFEVPCLDSTGEEHWRPMCLELSTAQHVLTACGVRCCKFL